MCCSKKCAKIFLVVFNTIFFVLGAGALALGIVLLVDKSYIINTLTRIPGAGDTVSDALDSISFLEASAYVLIAGGGIVFIIGACGCCGALRENKCMLVIYVIFVSIILCAEIAAGLLGYFYKADVDNYLQGFLNTTIEDYYTGATFDNSGSVIESIEPISAAWDFTMAYFECCGNFNYTDFSSYATKWDNQYNVTIGGSTTTISAVVPITCCKMVDASKFPSDLENVEFQDLNDCLLTGNADSTNHENCYDKIWNLLTTYAYAVLGVGIGVGVVELFGIISALALICAKKKDDD